MVDTSRIVNGDSLNVSLLVGTVVGSVLTTVWAMWTQAARAVGSRLMALILSPIAEGSRLLEELLLIPANSMDAAGEAAAEFFMLLEPLGPLAYVLGVVFALGTIWIAQRLSEVVSSG